MINYNIVMSKNVWHLYDAIFLLKIGVFLMTLVELFDSCQIENVIAALRFKPEKIVFVGFKEIMSKRRVAALERFFEEKNINIKLEYEIVGRYDFEYITKTLNNIIDNNSDCCFDLTGGKELVLVAMGVISTQRNVPMVQFNVRSGNLIAVKNFASDAEDIKSSMTLAESVILNGGAIAEGTEGWQQWDLNGDFRKDIETMWNLCRKKPALWNWQSGIFETIDKAGIGDGVYACVRPSRLKTINSDSMFNKELLEDLFKAGLISDFKTEEDRLTFRYKNEQVKRCISKAGNILELYVYMLLKEIAEEESGFYDDIAIGVIVDWDGVVHSDGNGIDTRNEIDVMTIRDLVPLFISCKNGEVHKEALYELETVAERFGGEYAKKILITTYVSRDEDSRRFIMQRSRDMNIDIIENVEQLDKEAFKAMLKRRVR